MPLLSPRAFPANSVMTQCWADRVTLSGDLTQAGHTNTHPCKLRPLPSSSTSPSTASTQTLPRLQPPPLKTAAASGFKQNAIIQVRKLPGRCLLAFLLVLVLVSRPVMGKPWYDETPHQITFQSRFCQPLSVEHLQRLMGPAFDEKKMASDMATAKRMFGTDFGDSGTAGYQGDDPRVSLVVDNRDLVEDEEEWDSEEEDTWINEREEDIYMEDGMLDRVEEEEDEVVERRTWLPRRNVLHRDLSKGYSSSSRNSRYTKYGLSGEDRRRHGKGGSVESDSYAYMKRRRRRSLERSGKHRGSYGRDRDELSPDDVVDEDDDEDDVNIDEDEYDDDDVDDDSTDSKDKKSTDSILPLRLILSGKNKSLRRKLKTKFRQKTKFLKRPPPWECKMTHKTLIMKKGVFPRYILDGKCKTSKCFYRLYECEPSKYNIKILQRDPNHCNPLPSLGNSTVYEESWNLSDHHVTVGCNCAKVRQKKRRRN